MTKTSNLFQRFSVTSTKLSYVFPINNDITIDFYLFFRLFKVTLEKATSLALGFNILLRDILTANLWCLELVLQKRRYFVVFGTCLKSSGARMFGRQEYLRPFYPAIFCTTFVALQNKFFSREAVTSNCTCKPAAISLRFQR